MWINNAGQIDWGSVPDWVGGVGSAGGLLLIYIGLRREIKRQRAEERFSQAAQARLIYATLVRPGDEVAEVTVHNVSRGPAFSINVSPMRLDEHGIPHPMDPAPIVGTEDQDGRINSDETMQFVVAAAPGGSLSGLTHVDLSFTDEMGYDWLRRGGTGQPELINSPVLPLRKRRRGRSADRAR